MKVIVYIPKIPKGMNGINCRMMRRRIIIARIFLLLIC